MKLLWNMFWFGYWRNRRRAHWLAMVTAECQAANYEERVHELMKSRISDTAGGSR